jgi:hypothetical protein
MGKRIWKLRPDWQDQFVFDAKDLANLFVNATNLWYEVEQIEGMKQGLFGKAEQVRQAIIDYLEKGEDNLKDHSLIYALNKFQREWLGEGDPGIFYQAKPTLKEFLTEQTWAVYRVDGSNRKFFGDTAFGPMWKDIPPEIEVPADLKLGSLKEVEEYLKV